MLLSDGHTNSAITGMQIKNLVCFLFAFWFEAQKIATLEYKPKAVWRERDVKYSASSLMYAVTNRSHVTAVADRELFGGYFYEWPLIDNWNHCA